MTDTARRRFSLAEQLSADATEYVEVEAHGGLYTLGSLTSLDTIEWMELNNDKTNPKGRYAGILLVVKCLVDPDTHERVQTDQLEATVEIFKHKNAADNGKLVDAALRLNAMNVKRGEEIKNASGETGTGVSPTDSASPSDATT